MSARSPTPNAVPTATPATLTRHELNGLAVRVADARNADAIGISGRVVSETENTLVIEGPDGRERQVPKAGAIFEFVLPSEADDGDEGDANAGSTDEPDDRTYVTVEGVRLVANPARRTERKRQSKWR